MLAEIASYNYRYNSFDAIILACEKMYALFALSPKNNWWCW